MNLLDQTILIIDDDTDNLQSLTRIFEREGYRVVQAETGKKGLDILRKEHVPVVLTDLMMPGEVDGLGVLATARELELNTEIILMTAYGTVETAVQAMKEGAYDFITKPFKRMQVLKTVERALEKQRLIHENRRLKKQLQEQQGTGEIIGKSPRLLRCLDIVRQAAPTEATILLQGASGTGKELFAKAIVERSTRTERPFVVVNCAALPESILESELFGYERGAFTGAVQRKIGRFEAAHGGTIFLDEIGEMGQPLQAKLLRVLQEGSFERLGGNETRNVDVRVIAATNKNLEQEVREGRFRDDLYYRLNVITIQLPGLAERREDIPLLAWHFLFRTNAKNNKKVVGFTEEAMQGLTRHDWPGNVRELENLVERAGILCRGELIDLGDLWDRPPEDTPGGPLKEYRIAYGATMEDIERRVIEQTLESVDGDKRRCAQILGISSRTIYRKLRQGDDPEGLAASIHKE